MPTHDLIPHAVHEIVGLGRGISIRIAEKLGVLVLTEQLEISANLFGLLRGRDGMEIGMRP
ncbi:hypothetical protein ABC668_05775, partial [Pseudomonas aeruginosa]